MTIPGLHPMSNTSTLSDSWSIEGDENEDCTTWTDWNIEKMKKGHELMDEQRTYSTVPSSADTPTKSSNVRSGTISRFSDNGARRNIWSQIAENGVIWGKDIAGSYEDYDEDYGDDYSEATLRGKCGFFFQGLLYEFIHACRISQKHPHIIFKALFIFVLSCTVSLVVLEKSHMESIAAEKISATQVALEKATWFSGQFSKVLLPLYSLQQAVLYSDIFDHLPSQIGSYGDVGSAPSSSGPLSVDGALNYRNVTGVCDNETLMASFHELVTRITKNQEMDGVLVNYRLAPNAVFCLADPLVNRRDFDDGSFDSTMEIGMDITRVLLKEPMWEKTMRHLFLSDNDNIAIMGPMPVTQDGITIMPEMFCAHLPINLPGYEFKLADGRSAKSWGFVMSFINWSKFMEQSGIYERFDELKFDFQVTRRDKLWNSTSSEYYEKIHYIAQSKTHKHGHNAHMNKEMMVSVPFSTANGEWVIDVYWDCGLISIFKWIKTLAVMLCLIFTFMFTAMLLERQQHKMLLYKIMPERAIAKIQRGRTVVERYNVVTVFFSDIIGFTNMCSVMSPVEVMKMLNDLYTMFDKLVEKHGVYKVETIGDAYMVVGGAPNRMTPTQAAEKVALFALDVVDFVEKFQMADGSSISVRCGIASGPVVAGVVGNAMPRYCFFGDTVNLASRMESTSASMKIQCPELTYQLLQSSPNVTFKLEARMENGVAGVRLKGKGLTNTFWVKEGTKKLPPIRGSIPDIELGLSDEQDLLHFTTSDESQDYVIAQNNALSDQLWEKTGQGENSLVRATSDRDVMIERIAAIIEYRLSLLVLLRDGHKKLNPIVKAEIKGFVAEIESMYTSVAFHNFEHVSHVTISMNKIVDTLRQNWTNVSNEHRGINKKVGQSAFEDFVLIFSALIHDVGHTGMGNNMLTSIQHSVALKYKGSCAERNSIQVGIDVLVKKEYKNLRETIYPTVVARIEFYKIYFWSILCTDIVDPDRLRMCEKRFAKVHEEGVNELADPRVAPDLCPVYNYFKDLFDVLQLTEQDIAENKGRLVIAVPDLQRCVCIEHLMQVADIAHIMQDFEIFVKWNFRLYKELIACHRKNLMPDPSKTWAKSQIGFIDNYVTILAERAEHCFGQGLGLNLVQLARKNKLRWDLEGERITEIFINEVRNDADDENLVLQKCFHYA